MADTTQSSGATDDQVAPEDDGILRLSTKEKAPAPEMLTLFYLDDEPYQVPKNPPPTYALRYLKLLRTEGQVVAGAYMLETMLGAEGYEALMNYEQLTTDQMDFILTAALRIATGKTERPKGPKSRQPGRSARRK